MTSLALWKAAVQDKSDFLERVLDLLEQSGVSYAVIGGVGVNAYCPPVFTEDLDVAIAAKDIGRVRALMAEHFKTRSFAHSLNVYDPGSKLQVQFQLDPEFAELVPAASRRPVIGLEMNVASPRDLLRSKLWAAQEPSRRPSKQFKDMADLARLVTAFPELEEHLPEPVRSLVRGGLQLRGPEPGGLDDPDKAR